MKTEQTRSLWKGILAGIVGGIAGSLVMKAYITGARRLRTGVWQTKFDQGGPSHQVADLVWRKTAGSPLAPDQRVVAGEIVHYLFGAIVGGIYGGLGEYGQWVQWGQGTLFGTGVFLAADESSMPALGLVKKPWEESTAVKAEHWLGHIAYGVPAELARASVRRLLD